MEEKAQPGFKSSKERLMLLLGGKALIGVSLGKSQGPEAQFAGGLALQQKGLVNQEHFS